ncbi:MAG: type II toxin-antitoxin system VapB family antitoxin [Kiritimatiellae bacterium]|nr:type II toxin-antitoxin system VapB family antitoxin [Kiritimatiellia bacterium]MDD4734843.1 type II toxin-antitoxin system VapB family antitoxin [Kiritimatiellia bacterium]
MRTTLDLPEALLTKAMKVSRQRTKTAVIITALEDFVRKNNLQELKAFKGTIDLNLDLNTLRNRK